MGIPSLQQSQDVVCCVLLAKTFCPAYTQLNLKHRLCNTNKSISMWVSSEPEFLFAKKHRVRRLPQAKYSLQEPVDIAIVYSYAQSVNHYLTVASFPGPTQLSVACSREKRERAWYIFSRESQKVFWGSMPLTPL